VLAFAFGAGLWTDPGNAATPLAVGLVVALGLAVALLLLSRASRLRFSRAAAWILLFALAGWARSRAGVARDPSGADPELPSAGPITVRGLVTGLPVYDATRGAAGTRPQAAHCLRPGRVLFDLEALQGAESGASFRVIVEDCVPEDLRRLFAGASIEVKGRLRRAGGANAMNDPRAAARPALLVTRAALVEQVEGADAGSMRRAVYTVRSWIHAAITSLYDGPHEGLLLSLLIGERSLLEPQVHDDLVETGTFHYLAISGQHVCLVMVLLFRLPFFAGLRTLWRLGLLAGFAALTGGQAPVLRAALTLGLHEVLLRLGRRPHALNTLGWAAVLILAAEPAALFDAGFQLSFTAVLAILTWGRRLQGDAADRDRERFLPRHLQRRRWRRLMAWTLDAVAVAVSASAATAPLILVHFQRFHPLAPLWNLLVGPLVVVLLAGGYLSVLAAPVAPWLASGLAVPTAFSADALTLFLRAAASVPGSCIDLPAPSVWQLAACASLLALGLLQRRRLVLLAALLSFAAAGAALSGRQEEVSVVRFDGTSGHATLLSMGRAGRLLLDAGSEGERAGARLAREILRRGVRRLSGVFLSDLRGESSAGVEALLDSLRVDRLFLPARLQGHAEARRIQELARRYGVPVEAAAPGDELVLGGSSLVRLKVLPSRLPSGLPRSERQTSLQLSVSVTLDAGGPSTVLELGGLDERGLALLLREGRGLAADVVLFTPRRGLSTLYDELLDCAEPDCVVLCGETTQAAVDLTRAWEGSGFDVASPGGSGEVRIERRASRWRVRRNDPRSRSRSRSRSPASQKTNQP
jgi:ComEC/Rec2-related protein